MAENQAKQSQKERLKEITDSIETGIKDMYESDKYRTYLQTMSRFHRYSFNNTLLIAMQRPDATLVAGFNKWRDGFDRNVKKGEKGIKIIAPVPYKVKEERTKLDPVTKTPLLDREGKVQTEEVERQIPTFRVVSVFDISQTEGKEIPTLVNDLMGNVENYEMFMEALNRSSIVPIEIKPIAMGTDGYYHLEDKTITIREGMSEIQTISATIHEMAHSKLHDKAILDEHGKPVKKDRNTEEVEAESISYAVCNYYGIETSDNSFGYIANWSKGKELKELKSSLELISKTSSELITDIDKHLAEITKERGIDLTKEVEPTTINDFEILATKIDDFTKGYDPYEYSDQVEDIDNHILTIRENLEVGKLFEIREFLEGIVDGDFSSAKEASELLKELDILENEKYPSELAFKVDDTYISIFEVNDGYDYSILDKNYNLLDGGQLDNPELTIYEALHEVSESDGDFPFTMANGIAKVDFAELTEKADNVAMSNIIGTIKYSDDSAIKHLENHAEQMKAPVANTDSILATNEFAPYFMPDPKISVEEVVTYGYISNELLPLTKERAIDLYNKDLAIFALYPDNTEAAIFDISEIDSHTGYFGIEKADWENFYEFKEQQILENTLTTLEEKEFLDSTKDSFAIFQIKDGAEFSDYRFASVRELETTGKAIDRDNYNLVYTSELQNVSSENQALNALYQDFNCERPSDFTGHSMSVSDIIAVKLNGVVSCHYVDSFGFKEVDNYLKTAELSTEQNYNQIDGTINNESIGFERKSVLAELRATPTTEQKEKDKTTKNKEMER